VVEIWQVPLLPPFSRGISAWEIATMMMMTTTTIGIKGIGVIFDKRTDGI
jgi:hypothetical protein